MTGVLVVAEHFDGQIAPISREIIGLAGTISSSLGGKLFVAVLSDDEESLIDQVNLDGVDEIVTVNVGSNHFDAAAYENAAMALGQELQPSLILMGHTANGIACAAALAAQLGAGFASDIIGLRFEDDGVVATRSAHAGKVNLDLAFPGKEAVVLTCRGATFPAPEVAGTASVRSFGDLQTANEAVVEHIAYIQPPAADIDIGKSAIILSIGRGIQNPDNIPRFSAISQKLCVTLGCSRPFADSGHLPKAHQVGQSGTVAANCRLYIAVGISGAVQHLYGMKHVDTVISVNTDPAAPIFGFSKFGSTVDALELAGALEQKLGIT
jgi:electron transfer flavoprotein alpha subunit